MFELRNENQVWYKSEDMIDWIFFGSLVIVEPKENNKNAFMIKKFDFDKKEYLPCKDYETYEYDDGFYEVKDSCFVVEQTEEAIQEYVPNAAELTLMEAQAELYEEQQSNNLTLMETMAEIYETILGGE